VSTQVMIPFPVFLDKDGTPLSEGYVYIGVSGSNPETAPQTAYWDDALTIPAAQPIRTMDGFLLRNGSPANVYTVNAYSITVRDKNYGFVYSSLSAIGYGISAAMLPVVTAATLADARDALGVSKKIKGYQSVSLTHFSDLLEPSIAAGSEIEVGGTFYEFPTDETAVAGGWAGIATSSVVYMYVVPAGAAHTWIYSTTAPTWDTAKQGWYNGNNRCFGKLFKDASSNYTEKAIAQSLYTVNNTEPLNSYVKMTPVSGYTPVVGDPVETVTDGSSVWIRKAKRVGAPFGVGSAGVKPAQTFIAAPINATQAICLYCNSVDNSLRAVVATVSLNDLSITQGAEATIATLGTLVSADIAVLSSTLALVVYSAGGVASAVTLTISGTTLTVNAPVAGPTPFSGRVGLVRASATSAVASWPSALNTASAQMITVSGTTPTWSGSAAVLTWAIGNVTMSYKGAIADDGLQYIVEASQTASPYAHVLGIWTISGSTLTVLGSVTIYPAGVSTALSIFWLQPVTGMTNVFVGLHIQGDSAASYINGLALHTIWRYASTVSAGGGRFPINANQVSCNTAWMSASVSNELVFFIGEGTEAIVTNVRRTRGRFVRMSRGDLASIVAGDDIVIDKNYGDNGLPIGSFGCYGCMLPNSNIALIPMTMSSSTVANNCYLVAVRRRDSVIGLAADGAGLVQTAGVFITSGLVVGKDTSIDDAGALTQAVIGEVKLGIAKSATELMLNVRPGV
jgi:hypothetical protein